MSDSKISAVPTVEGVPPPPPSVQLLQHSATDMSIVDGNFVDRDGRVLLLRGCNVGSASKV
jgi:hypothetical protein